MCPHEKHNSHQELYSRNEHSEKACNYRKVITRLLSMPKMRKLLSKVSTVLRIGYCILIIYIPILRYGNCTKFPQMEYNIAYYKAVITKQKSTYSLFSSKYFSNNILACYEWKERSWYFAHQNSWNVSINFRKRSIRIQAFVQFSRILNLFT